VDRSRKKVFIVSNHTYEHIQNDNDLFMFTSSISDIRLVNLTFRNVSEPATRYHVLMFGIYSTGFVIDGLLIENVTTKASSQLAMSFFRPVVLNNVILRNIESKRGLFSL